MEKGIIGKILDYYFSSPQYSRDVEGAMIEFFDIESIQELRRSGVEEKAMEFFSEWFVFDYKWTNKKSTLSKFVSDNPLYLNSASLQIYKNLQNNQYGTWEVVSVNPGHGLQLENLQTGKRFNVQEHSATFQLHLRDIFYSRLSLVDDHWEMIGANTFIWGVKFNKSVKDIWRKDKTKSNPKDAYKMWNSQADDNSNDVIKFNKNLSSEQAEEKLAEILKKFKIDSYVTTDLIAKWIYNLSKNMISHTETIDRLTGLINFDEISDSLDVDELIRVYNDFYNLSPQKCLKDRSPSQLVSKDPDCKFDFEASVTSIGHGEDMDKVYKNAHENMKTGNYFRALKDFDKYFKELLRRRTTIFYIYRMYANKAVCHFACGQNKEGKSMINIALELNPNYDFGLKLLRQYEEGRFKFDIRDTLGIKPRHDYLKKDISVRYFDFIKELGINFATPVLTTSDIRMYNQKGEPLKVGRNDPCPCGSKHPDGRPKKHKKCHGK